MNEIIDMMYSVMKQLQMDIQYICKKHEDLYPTLKKEILTLLPRNDIEAELDLCRIKDWEESVSNYAEKIMKKIDIHIKLDMSVEDNPNLPESMYSARELAIELLEKIVVYKCIQALIPKIKKETAFSQLNVYYFQLGQLEAKMSNLDQYLLGKIHTASQGGKILNNHREKFREEIKKIIPDNILYGEKKQKNINKIIEFIIENCESLSKKLNEIDENYSCLNNLSKKQIEFISKSYKLEISYNPETKTRNDQKLDFLYKTSV